MPRHTLPITSLHQVPEAHEIVWTPLNLATIRRRARAPQDDRSQKSRRHTKIGGLGLRADRRMGVCILDLIATFSSVTHQRAASATPRRTRFLARVPHRSVSHDLDCSLHPAVHAHRHHSLQRIGCRVPTASVSHPPRLNRRACSPAPASVCRGSSRCVFRRRSGVPRRP